MLSQTKNIPDEQILLMFAENNLEAWEHLYDKYAPTMYGIIFSLSDDRTLAEDIFKEAFLQLKEKRILSGISHLLCSFLLRYTHTFARQQLKERGIDYSENPIVEASITNTLCSQHISIKEAASTINLTEDEAKKKLRAEFLHRRFRNQYEVQIQHQQLERIEQYAINGNSINK